MPISKSYSPIIEDRRQQQTVPERLARLSMVADVDLDRAQTADASKPDLIRKQLEQNGYRVEQRPALVSMKLDDGHRGAVAMTETGLQHAGVAAFAGLVAFRDGREQLADDLLIAQIGDGLTAGVQVAALAEGDQLLGHRAKVLGLRQGGLDLLMLQQGNGEIGEKGLTGRAGAVQLATAHTMTH